MPPKRDNNTAGIAIMAMMLDVRTIRTVTWRNHQAYLRRCWFHSTSIHDVFPIEFIHRHVAYFLFAHFYVTSCSLFLHHLQSLIELVAPTIVVNRSVITSSLQLFSFLQRSRTRCIQTNNRHQGDNKRQLQAELHSFVCMIITLSKGASKELPYRAAQIIGVIPFRHISANFVYSVLKHFLQLPGTFGRLRCILRHILHDRPQIQDWTPINVTHIGQQYVGVVTATQAIIARKLCMPLSLSLAFL